MRCILKLPKLNYGRIITFRQAKKATIYLIAILVFDFLFFAFPVVANRSAKTFNDPVEQIRLVLQIEEVNETQDYLFIIILVSAVILFGFLVYRFF